MRITTSLFVISCLTVLGGCDPGHGGKSYINNKTGYTLILHTNGHMGDTTFVITAGQRWEVLDFGGLGAGKDFDCCPCKFSTITLTVSDTSKTITKQIANHNNWMVTNPNTRRIHSREIICEFLVTSADIQ